MGPYGPDDASEVIIFTCYGVEYVNKETGQAMLDFFFLGLYKILCQLLHELKAQLKVLNRGHLDLPELQAHQQRHDGLGGVSGRLSTPQFT